MDSFGWGCTGWWRLRRHGAERDWSGLSRATGTTMKYPPEATATRLQSRCHQLHEPPMCWQSHTQVRAARPSLDEHTASLPCQKIRDAVTSPAGGHIGRHTCGFASRSDGDSAVHPPALRPQLPDLAPASLDPGSRSGGKCPHNPGPIPVGNF